MKPILICLVALLGVSGCKKLPNFLHRKTAEKTSTQAGAAASPAPSTPPLAAATPTMASPAPAINKHATAIVLCYHNIEDNSKMKALTISVAEFEKEMQTIKDNGFTVIGMQDFLAWRRGEKDIPMKSAIITIDDGWVSGYDNAWPILKKYGYPFTMFIYVNYVGSGGKSLSWDQLGEMRDAGVDIQCHTYSHSNLKFPGGGMDRTHSEEVKKEVATLGMDGWIRKEILGSKAALEKQLGIKVNAIAYPFGVYNQKSRELVKEGGYDAAFTVYGQQLRFSSPPSDLLGRYAVEATKPQIFADAMKMIGGGTGGGVADAGPAVAQLAASSMITQPAEGETIKDPLPTIKANLATMGEIDAGSLEMRVSGLGPVPAKYDAATKMVTYKVTQPLRDKNYTVILAAKSQGKKVETRWTFNFDPKAAAPPQ